MYMWSCFFNDLVFYHFIIGSGEDCCLHEVRQIHEDSHQQQDGQMGEQERVKVDALRLKEVMKKTNVHKCN